MSNHRIDSLTEQGQRSNDTNGTTVYEIFSCIFSLFSCGCCSWLLDVKSTQECEVFEKYAIKIRKKQQQRHLLWQRHQERVAQKAVMMAVDGGLISQDGGERVCTQCHMMASDQSRLTPNVFSDAVVSTTFGFDYSEERKVRTPKWKLYEKVCKRPLTIGHKWHTCVCRVVALNIPGQVHPQFQNPQICPPQALAETTFL